MTSWLDKVEKGKMDLKIGCCGFSLDEEKYYERFMAIELQDTFNKLPDVEIAQKLRSDAPDNFVFTMRACQTITHEGCFRSTDEVLRSWEQTAEIAGTLKAGAIVFQSPDSFRPTRENKNNFVRFFRAAKRTECRLVWEPPKGWFRRDIKKLCEKLDIIHCVDPFVGGKSHGDIAYFRMKGKDGPGYRYNGWDLKSLRDLCEEESERIGQKPIYVFFNNVSMTMDAQRFEWIASHTGPIKNLTLSFLKGLCQEIEAAEEDEKVQKLSREAEKIVSLILHTDYAKVDIIIEKEKLREMCKELFPDKEYLYDMIYGHRFERLWEQFRKGEDILS